MDKIAMYTTNRLFEGRQSGGTKRFTELYYGLRRLGIDVDLYCGDAPEVLVAKNIEAYALKSLKRSQSLFIPTELKNYFSNIKNIRKIKKKAYNKVIVFDVPTAISLSISRVRHIQLFIRQNLLEYRMISLQERTNSQLVRIFYGWLLKVSESICLISAEHIIIQCMYDYDALLKRHKIIKHIIVKKTTIQINNVNPSWIVEMSKADSPLWSEEMLSSYSDKLLIGYVGNFGDERKGHRIFVEAIRVLIDDGLRINAVLVGDGKLLEVYKAECKDYQSISFLGRLDNPLPVMRACDLIVVPSMADSCPNTVMEALYNETPVIGTKSGGIPEILNDEMALFENNANSLAEKIVELSHKGNLLKLKEKQKTRKAELTFEWSEKIYQHLGLS